MAILPDLNARLDAAGYAKLGGNKRLIVNHLLKGLHCRECNTPIQSDERIGRTGLCADCRRGF